MTISPLASRPGPAGRGRPWLVRTGVAFLLLAGSPVGFAGEAKEGGGSIGDLEKRLSKAVAAGAWPDAAAAMDALAATGDPRGFDAIIRLALSGGSYELEARGEALIAASADAKVRAMVMEASRKNASFKTRIILLGVIARWKGDAAALAALHGALKDPKKPVVLAALYWIRRIGSKESIEPLIAEMSAREKKAVDRVYFDIKKTLAALTEVDLDVAADYRNFWEAQKKGLSAPPRKGGEGRTSVARRDSFFSVVVDSDRVLFVIDVSGSMTVRDPVTDSTEEEDESKERGKTVIVKKDKPKAAPKAKEPPPSRERMFRVKSELVRLIAGLQPSTQFGILCFSHELHYVWGDARSLRPATSESKAAATAWVKALKANGATRTDKALEDALAIPEVDTVFLLTDGAPKDEKDQRMPIEPILARAKQMNRFLRARIHTISFQQIRDTRMRTFVRDLSIQNDGGEPTLLP